mmetsp:Transcript_12367/g.17751  ORF Transcript_12367/g.17751 Transcript_12367/m.17751 type:complete len:386 (-) Transcript_12367:170-1327(-)|eukprot:CAMPEP_0201691648 /NCGR_PEP_ID=MMETSP0578-20130828/4769_1 /ASSEMBLY_ACC=CAM_ASM_000663 /TAXON_ID=267565 /ORGANISM="Skeletonema grethea, Strain CCMP 1804" /LENGTH=385 /DNA_ID=CAMNT_0048176903 /DNA_START=56 /DNA_END=1213 /DNA_ORIENTATION=+
MSSRRIKTRQPRPLMLMRLLILTIAFTTLTSSLSPLHKSSVTAQPTSSSPQYYTNHIPIRYKVNQKQTECLYDRYEQGEQVTSSVFIVETLKNGKPICNVLFEGPITTQSLDDESNNNNRKKFSLGRTIRQGLLDKIPQNIRDNPTNSLNIRIRADWTHAGEEQDKLLLRQELERENNSKRTQHADSDPLHRPILTFAAPKIEPFEMTHSIPATGYYRVCAQAELHALVVEMDVRSSVRMGGVDEETGHVYSYVKRGLLDEEAAIDDDTTTNNNKNGKRNNGQLLDSNTYQSTLEELSKILNNQISDGDLEETKFQIKVLNAKTSEILTEIQTRMTRVRAHEQSARRNSANLAWSSKVETVLFAVITGFQVYTMRKWLLQNTLLG